MNQDMYKKPREIETVISDRKMREKIIVIVFFLSTGILAAPREFLWEEEDDETESPETFFDKPKPIPTTTSTTTTTTTEKHFILKPKPKPEPEPTTTTTEKPKPFYPHHPQPQPPFHHKPPHGPPLPPPPPQYFQNPFVFPPRPFLQPLPPIGLLASPAFSLERPNPDAVEEDDISLRRLLKDEGVKHFDSKVASPCVGETLGDDTNPCDIARRVKRQATEDNDRKNWVRERRKKKKKKQKPTPKPVDTLSEENSSSTSITTPFQGTIKEESIEGIQTSTQNTSQSTQTHLVAYYMVYVVEVQQSSANNNSTVVSEQTTSNANQVTASPEASFIAEAAGAIPTEETFTQFQGTAASTGKPGGISIDQTGSSTNNGHGEEEGNSSDEDEDIFPPVFDLSDDKHGETRFRNVF